MEHVSRAFAALTLARDSLKAVANGYHGRLRIALPDGATPSRLPVHDTAKVVVGAHLFTPETENSTRYFFAASYPRSLDPGAEKMAQDSIAVAASPTGPFVAED